MIGLLSLKRWSITQRLSVAFALISLLLMSSVGIYLASAFDRQLYEQHQVSLANDIESIRTRLADTANDSPDVGERWEQMITTIGSRLHIAIFDEGKNVIASKLWAGIPSGALPTPAGIGQRASDLVAWRSAQGEDYWLVTAWAAVGQTQKVMIALARDVTLEKRLLAGYRNTLLITLVVAVLGAAVIGYVVAHHGLAPVRRIAAIANEITSAQLDKRLEIEGSPTELRDLIGAFNRMLDRLHDSFLRLSQFSSDLAHELRTPINNLMGEAQVTLSRARAAEDYRSVLESSVEEFERLSRMIESMLFLARADNAQSVIPASLFDARVELDKIAEFYQLVADESSVRIKCEGTAKVWADPLLFRRAVSNLLSNALRYTANGELILMQAAANADGSTSVTVRNPGPGIAAEHIPQIFDRFYRADPAREKHSEGAGLGLAIVRTIMQMHGGSVSATSTPDEFTVFTLQFPAAPRAAAT